MRTEAQDSLPGLSFTVRNDAGDEVRFSHEEGTNPAEEAELFCELHFSAVPLHDCVQAMLQNAEAALQDVLQEAKAKAALEDSTRAWRTRQGGGNKEDL